MFADAPFIAWWQQHLALGSLNNSSAALEIGLERRDILREYTEGVEAPLKPSVRGSAPELSPSRRVG